MTGDSSNLVKPNRTNVSKVLFWFSLPCSCMVSHVIGKRLFDQNIYLVNLCYVQLPPLPTLQEPVLCSAFFCSFSASAFSFSFSFCSFCCCSLELKKRGGPPVKYAHGTQTITRTCYLLSWGRFRCRPQGQKGVNKCRGKAGKSTKRNPQMKPAFGGRELHKPKPGSSKTFPSVFPSFETELLTPPQVSLQIASSPNLARLDPTSWWSRGMPSHGLRTRHFGTRQNSPLADSSPAPAAGFGVASSSVASVAVFGGTKTPKGNRKADLFILSSNCVHFKSF